MSAKAPDKERFRAALSGIWLILNSIILGERIYNGYFDARILAVGVLAVALVFGGVHIGGRLPKRVSQSRFVGLTNVPLAVSGLSLIVKRGGNGASGFCRRSF
ncbi:MAG: hypothetical protein LBU23_08845 [Planctomycetota bacterium]|jgi:hypothetical protein|nr:hypothetical protein [Planctomycetota bacterium]